MKEPNEKQFFKFEILSLPVGLGEAKRWQVSNGNNFLVGFVSKIKGT